jgi:hypothetical protein
MKRTVAAGIIVAALTGTGLAVGLTAHDSGKQAPVAVTGNSSAKAAASAGAHTANPKADRSSRHSIGGFGADHAVRYPDGLQIAVLAVDKFQPSSTAFGVKPNTQAVAFTVQITNGTSQTLDAGVATVTLATGASGMQADNIYDDPSGVGGFAGDIPPGRTLTSKIGFNVPPADLLKLRLGVTPPDKSEHADASFEGGLV